MQIADLLLRCVTKTKISGNTLLIDGNGYLFYLIQTEEGLRSVHRELGGNYSAIDSLIRDHIKLLRAADINLKVSNPNCSV